MSCICLKNRLTKYIFEREQKGLLPGIIHKSSDWVYYKLWNIRIDIMLDGG